MRGNDAKEAQDNYKDTLISDLLEDELYETMKGSVSSIRQKNLSSIGTNLYTLNSVDEDNILLAPQSLLCPSDVPYATRNKLDGTQKHDYGSNFRQLKQMNIPKSDPSLLTPFRQRVQFAHSFPWSDNQILPDPSHLSEKLKNIAINTFAELDKEEEKRKLIQTDQKQSKKPVKIRSKSEMFEESLNNNMKDTRNVEICNEMKRVSEEYDRKYHQLRAQLRIETDEQSRYEKRIRCIEEEKIFIKKLLHDTQYRVELCKSISELKLILKTEKENYEKLKQHEKYLLNHPLHKQLKHNLKIQSSRRKDSASKNFRLEAEIIEAYDTSCAVREELNKVRHNKYIEILKSDPDQYNWNRLKHSYPPYEIIYENLLRRLLEFVFSDYNLKRDKKLLKSVCEKRIGVLQVNKVLELHYLRSLNPSTLQLVRALNSSKLLQLSDNDEWVGRAHFTPPMEKYYPFRHTVFIFGLPLNADDDYLREMCEPFGKISRFNFDHGPDTVDRKIAHVLLEVPRANKLLEKGDNPKEMHYNYGEENKMNEFSCKWCGKTKKTIEGFYCSQDFSEVICIHCAGQHADKQMQRFENLIEDKEISKETTNNVGQQILGELPRPRNKTKTALVVFRSQRMAAKCVFVRSRLGWNGCFATHYAHYSKIKKELILALKAQQYSLENIDMKITSKTDQSDILQFITEPINCNKLLWRAKSKQYFHTKNRAQLSPSSEKSIYAHPS